MATAASINPKKKTNDCQLMQTGTGVHLKAIVSVSVFHVCLYVFTLPFFPLSLPAITILSHLFPISSFFSPSSFSYLLFSFSIGRHVNM
jgi:hypothetical protein